MMDLVFCFFLNAYSLFVSSFQTGKLFLYTKQQLQQKNLKRFPDSQLIGRDIVCTLELGHRLKLSLICMLA